MLSFFPKVWPFGGKAPRRLPIRKAQRPSLELLEDRLVPTVTTADFLSLQKEVKSFLSGLTQVGGALDTIVEASHAKLPIIDKSLGELVGIDHSIDDFKAAVDTII